MLSVSLLVLQEANKMTLQRKFSFVNCTIRAHVNTKNKVSMLKKGSHISTTVVTAIWPQERNLNIPK